MEKEQLTVEACLERYPQHRVELDELLRVATAIRQMPSVQPSAAFIMHARTRLMKQLKPRPISLARLLDRSRGGKRNARRKRLLSRPSMSWLSIAALILVLILGSGVGVAYAADGAAPGDFLYGIDTAMEAVQLAFAPNGGDRAQLELRFAQERLEEINHLFVEGNSGENIQLAVNGYSETIRSAVDDLVAVAASGDTERASALTALFYASLSTHGQVLDEMMSKAPEPAKSAIDRARSVSEQGKAVVEELFANGMPADHPSDLAPGGIPTTFPSIETEQPGAGQDQKMEPTPTQVQDPTSTEAPVIPTTVPIPTHPGVPTSPSSSGG